DLRARLRPTRFLSRSVPRSATGSTSGPVLSDVTPTSLGRFTENTRIGRARIGASDRSRHGPLIGTVLPPPPELTRTAVRRPVCPVAGELWFSTVWKGSL